MRTIEDHFKDWESEVFGFGYGSGEEHVLGAVKQFLEAVGRDDSERAYDYEVLEKSCGATAAWLLINTFGHWRIIEYGTSPRYGWLTKEGEALRDFVKSKSLEELADLATTRSEDDCICAPSFCNCGPNGYSEKKLCFNPFWVNE
jgi:hypothetical protein